MIKHSKDDQDQPFLSRWSKRKRQATETENVSDSSIADFDESGDPGAAEPQIPLNTILPSDTTGRMLTGVEADRLSEPEPGDTVPHKVLTDEDMPSVDSLDENSDYAGFMSSGVSDKLRKVALRKLFAGAGFNIRDGLDDYDDDFTSFPPLGDIVTSDMKHRQEMEEEKRRLERAEAERLAAEEQQDKVTEESAETAEDTQSVDSQLEADGEQQPDQQLATDTETETEPEARAVSDHQSTEQQDDHSSSGNLVS